MRIVVALMIISLSLLTSAKNGRFAQYNVRCPISSQSDVYINTNTFWVAFTIAQDENKQLNSFETLNIAPGQCQDCYDVMLGTPTKGATIGNNDREILLMHLRKYAIRSQRHSRYHMQIDILDKYDRAQPYLPDTNCYEN